MRFIKPLFWVALFLAAGIASFIFVPGSFTLRDLRLADGKVGIPELKVSWNLGSLKHPYMILRAPKATVGAVEISDITAFIKGGAHTITALRLQYRKTELKDVRALLSWKDGALMADGILAQFVGQEIRGNGSWSPGTKGGYRLALTAAEFPAQALIDTMEWQKKVSVSGKFIGKLDLAGNGPKLSSLEGTFDAWPAGGEITVLDPALLQRLADSSHQPIEIVEASFKRYVYNSGLARLSLQKNDLMLKLELDGDAGKRNLEVNLHDLFSS